MAASLKVAVITGAGSGIGRSAALALAGEGYATALAGRNAERLSKVAEELPALAGGARHLAVPADVTNPDSVKALFARVREAFGRLDLLFNNAGVFVPGASVENVTIEQ
ncbi:MAG TPA: SDR family NAD(P)-dependent oxidoreductase, partial [Terracidiphilus sp.]|nr:SDR family NAD(P)-dependent oxidoreductase [Terracidiphilus sp.]